MTGTGAGVKLFCGGVGERFPDMVNTSRPMKASEYADCAKAGAKNVIEVPVGIDGLTLIQAKGQPPLNLTLTDIYKALAANPFGKPQTATTWKDVNPRCRRSRSACSGRRRPAAPRQPCRADPRKGLRQRSGDEGAEGQGQGAHKAVCSKVREDGAFVEAGENDNLLVQKVAADPGALGVLGYSFLEENADKVAPVSIAGVAPTEATISDLSTRIAQAVCLYQGRAYDRQAGDQAVHRGLCQGDGHGRYARQARAGAACAAEARLRWRRRRRLRRSIPRA